MSVLAMILAGGTGPGLHILTATRAEPAVPFGGKYRVIDFPLSNCVNSGIHNVAVLTQYMPRTLNDHIRAGKPWDLDRAEGGVRLLQPYQSLPGVECGWQEGSADAVRFNLDLVSESEAKQVLVLAGNHIYKMDYGPMLEFHKARAADVTVAVRAVSPHQTHRFGMVTADSDGRITRFEEKPRRTRSTLSSMGIYVFEAAVLQQWLQTAGHNQRHLGAETIPSLIGHKRLYAYTFEGYWANIGTVPSYFEANMGLLSDIPALDLSDPRWIIHTRSEQRPPVYLASEACVQGNLLCDGAVIEGCVVRSVIGPGVVVDHDAEVRDSIVMTDAVIGAGAQVDRAIVDKEAVIGAGACVGWGGDNTPNDDLPEVLNTGITLVGKQAHVAADVVIGRNVVIAPAVSAEDLPSGPVPSGASVSTPLQDRNRNE
jgi:glucose-1-phosphate adenylyltransferase